MSAEKKRHALQLIKDHARPAQQKNRKSDPAIRIYASYIRVDSSTTHHHHNATPPPQTDAHNQACQAEITKLKEAVLMAEYRAKNNGKKPLQEGDGTLGWMAKIRRVFLKEKD